jgi:hypothetical protein
MKTHFLAVTLCAFIIVSGHSVAQTGGDISIGPTNPAVPIKPGDVRVGTRAPPGDWDVQVAPNRSQRVYKCKPLACPDAETGQDRELLSDHDHFCWPRYDSHAFMVAGP